jgi:hypothetical protein
VRRLVEGRLFITSPVFYGELLKGCFIGMGQDEMNVALSTVFVFRKPLLNVTEIANQFQK